MRYWGNVNKKKVRKKHSKGQPGSPQATLIHKIRLPALSMRSKLKQCQPVTQTSLLTIKTPDFDLKISSSPFNNSPSGICRPFSSSRQSQRFRPLLRSLHNLPASSHSFKFHNNSNGASSLRSRISVPPNSKPLFSQHRVFKVKLLCLTNNKPVSVRHRYLVKLVLLPLSRTHSAWHPNLSKTSQLPWELQALRCFHNSRRSS